jgi:hypothetical protein
LGVVVGVVGLGEERAALGVLELELAYPLPLELLTRLLLAAEEQQVQVLP